MDHFFGLVALLAILSEFVVSTTVSVLNLKALGEVPPPELADVYDVERYAEAQRYARVRARFGLVTRSFDLVLLLGFWFLGGFELLDRWVRSFELPTVARGLIFIFTLGIAHSLVLLPFRIYDTFVLEQRFGFNRTTARTFVTDMLKGLALTAVLGVPALAGALWLFERMGSLAFLYAWVAAAALILVLQFIAPAWIMPLFMRFTPLPDGELRERIMSYARSVAFPLENLFIVDGSKRSTKANAFFTGFGTHRRIGLFDTLIERCTPDELISIVAHEVGHYKKRHVTNGMVISIAQLGLMLFVFGELMRFPPLYAAFSVTQPSVYAGLTFCSLLYEPISLVLSLLLLARSRRNEYEADRFAVETTGLGEALVSGLKRLAGDSLSNLSPHPSYVFVHHSHPPLRERVLAIREAPSSPTP
ncbi:MAG TPA: M48 family metallopeptidase [Polyangiales bacterium]|nr:M48 family metallopeptidase [Polyangiales bacterium]